jgi:general transcription factor 3C polypeptide 3 (transcription factor C subunit 4)
VLEDEDLDTSDYLELFREAADALRESGYFAEALEFYNVLKQANQSLNSRFYFDLAICYQALGRNNDMREAVQHMRYGDRDPTMQMGLAKIYESQGRIDLMWRLCLELKKMGYQELLAKNNLPTVRPAELSVLDENVPLPISFSRLRARPLKVVKSQKRLGNLSALQLKQEEAARDLVTKALFDDMCNLAQPIADGDINARSEWMRLGSEIFEEFRGYAKFFPSDPLKLYDEKDKERVVTFPAEEEIPDQLDFELPKTWREIALDDLVDLILQYGIFLANDGAKAMCFNVLRLLERSSLAWAHRERRTAIGNVRLRKCIDLLFTYADMIDCAIKLHDAVKANECGRTFFKSDPFSTNSYRLPSAIHRAVHGDADAFGFGPEQKFWLRQIKIVDFLNLTPKERDVFYKTKKAMRTRDGVEQTVKSQSLHVNAPELDADLLALYGHMLLVAGAATTSLNYYFRAYVLRPDDAMINLCLALGYLNWAWKRQSANRQFMIQQGFAFLNRYAELRRKVAIETRDDAKLQEVEFNEAMAYGHMGLFHLAVPRLMKCLEIGDNIEAKRTQKHSKSIEKNPSKANHQPDTEPEANGITEEPLENFTPEAAFALRNILALNGDLHGAHEIMKKYLVL